MDNTNPEAVPSSEGLGCKESNEKCEKEAKAPQPKKLSTNTQELLEPQILTNYFPVTFEPNWCIYQYSVCFFPRYECEGLRKDEETLMMNNLSELGTFLYAVNDVPGIPG